MKKWNQMKYWRHSVALLLCMGLIFCFGISAVFAQGTESGETTANVSDFFLFGELPQGFTQRDAGGEIEILQGENVVAGVRSYILTQEIYDPYDRWFTWLQDVGIEDYMDETLTETGGMSGADDGWDVYFQSVCPEGEEPTVEHSHHFMVKGGILFDLWMDTKSLDAQVQSAIKAALNSAQQVQRMELEYVRNGEAAHCEMRLHDCQGYSIYLPESDDWVWGHRIVEGIPTQLLEYWGTACEEDSSITLQIATLAGKELIQAQHWARDKWSDYELLEDKRGGLGGADENGNLLEISFYTAENVTYALMLTYSQADAESFGSLLSMIGDTFALQEGSAGMTKEEANYLRCFAVMNGLYWTNDSQISWTNRITCQEDETVTMDYLNLDEDVLLIQEVNGPAWHRSALLLYGEDAFTNEGTEDQPGEIIWEPCEDYEYSGTWLTSFYWSKHYVTYLGTDWQGDAQCIRFRIDAWFDEAGEIPGYFATFFFDEDGNFLKVQLNATSAQGDTITATETIVTRDEETIRTRIEEEYRRTQG